MAKATNTAARDAPPTSDVGSRNGRAQSQRNGPRRDASGKPMPGHHASRAERKAHVLTQHTASLVRSISDAVVIKDAEPFFLCPPDGQIPLEEGHGFGLYQHDTRFLSGYELRVADATPNSLAGTAVTGARAVLELTMPAVTLGDGRSIGKERLAVRWERELDGNKAVMRDWITVHNYDRDAARIPLRVRFAADFHDVFVIRGLISEQPGTLHEPRWDGDSLVFSYSGKDGVDRRTRITFSQPIESRDADACLLSLEVPGRGSAQLSATIAIQEELQPGATPIERRTRKSRQARQNAQQPDSQTATSPESGGDGWPVEMTSDSLTLNAALSRSLDDLLTLRGELDGYAYYGAGVPWFSTLFGRDALIAAYQTLAFDSTIAAGTLRLLASRQGTKTDDFRDEQPGKILHELRVGELARLHEIPQTPYYGTIDATPLFLVLLARHADWTGSLALFEELRPHVDRALAWLDGDADPAGNGFIAYDSSRNHGLANQGWKDSGDGIVTADGEIAHPPIALAEVQGYAYAARREIADLFDQSGDRKRASHLRAQAETLRQRFERNFWLEDVNCYALALQGDGSPCSVVTSNAGQVLWSGICDRKRASDVAHRLLKKDMFSGWGIRTLSYAAAAFNPIGYHLGTVWPHDNGLIAEGFRRYGLDDEAERVFVGLLEASTEFPQQRLPECFAGFARSDFGIPVRYPIACHPQAWAAGSIPHLLTISLGFRPKAFERRLTLVRPRLGPFLEQLEVRGLRVGEARVDIVFQRHGDRTDAKVGRIEGELDIKVEES